MADYPFLGTGWTFPPTFSNQGRSLGLVSGAENVHKSIQIILRTEFGERVFREEFGAGLSRYQFEPVTQSLVNRMRDTVTEAILRHEPRVDLNEVEISQNEINQGLLLISMSYTIRVINSRFNMVYPFYLDESENQ